MHSSPHPRPQHKTHTIKLLAITHRLQMLMINENLTPTELVSCANAVKLKYEAVVSMSAVTPKEV